MNPLSPTDASQTTRSWAFLTGLRGIQDPPSTPLLCGALALPCCLHHGIKPHWEISGKRLCTCCHIKIGFCSNRCPVTLQPTLGSAGLQTKEGAPGTALGPLMERSAQLQAGHFAGTCALQKERPGAASLFLCLVHGQYHESCQSPPKAPKTAQCIWRVWCPAGWAPAGSNSHPPLRNRDVPALSLGPSAQKSTV